MLSCIQTSVAFFNRPKSLVVCCKCTEYIYCHRYTRIFWSMVYHKRYCGPNKDRRIGASAALPYLNQRWFCCDDHADCILSHSACYSALSFLRIMFSPFSFSFFPEEEGKKKVNPSWKSFSHVIFHQHNGEWNPFPFIILTTQQWRGV